MMSRAVVPEAVDVQKATAISKHPIYCLPAADEADEIVAVMMAQLLEREGYKAESLSHKTLANEMVAHVAEAGSAAVCGGGGGIGGGGRVVPPYDNLHNPLPVQAAADTHSPIAHLGGHLGCQSGRNPHCQAEGAVFGGPGGDDPLRRFGRNQTFCRLGSRQVAGGSPGCRPVHRGKPVDYLPLICR